MGKTKKLKTDREEESKTSTTEKLSSETEEMIKLVKEQSKREEDILEKLETEKYSTQGYKAGDKVEIPASLFNQLTTNSLNNKEFCNNINILLDSLDKNLMQLRADAKLVYLTNQNYACSLLETHIQNVDEGKTTPHADIDKEDSQRKIQEVEE